MSHRPGIAVAVIGGSFSSHAQPHSRASFVAHGQVTGTGKMSGMSSLGLSTSNATSTSNPLASSVWQVCEHPK